MNLVLGNRRGQKVFTLLAALAKDLLLTKYMFRVNNMLGRESILSSIPGTAAN